MHDLDRPQLESEEETFESESDQFLGGILGGILGEVEGEESESPLGETEEIELATELLEVSDEQELEEFLGDLVRRASQAAGQFVRSDTGRALGGILRSAARQSLPVIGGALGARVAPGRGAAVGARLATQAGKLFGLELEGLSSEDREFEAARQFVRFAATATKNAAGAPPTASPAAVAKAATATAARRFAPGLAPTVLARRPAGGWPSGSRSSGTWVRRGRVIVLDGV